MSGYVGQHRDYLVSNWGPPAEEKKLKNGGYRLVYREENPLIHPSQYVDPALRICEKVFITDSRGIHQILFSRQLRIGGLEGHHLTFQISNFRYQESRLTLFLPET